MTNSPRGAMGALSVAVTFVVIVCVGMFAFAFVERDAGFAIAGAIVLASLVYLFGVVYKSIP